MVSQDLTYNNRAGFGAQAFDRAPSLGASKEIINSCGTSSGYSLIEAYGVFASRQGLGSAARSIGSEEQCEETSLRMVGVEQLRDLPLE